RNLCNAVYFEAEEKTCLHLLLNASQALHEYTESRKETIHFIEKCVEVAEQQEYQQESVINRIPSDETSLSLHQDQEAVEHIMSHGCPTHMQTGYFHGWAITVLKTRSPNAKNIQRTKPAILIYGHDDGMFLALEACFNGKFLF
ncbi:hypothetical protein Tsp_15305, partial [Trichinella spiralis]|uniref:hypothetical protein n=1 Tax=Trichinella spiralis TaxID=6334 RepID=UPI0001EFE64C